MHGEHDPTQDRRPGAARRGRRPYGEPAEPAEPPRAPSYGTADDPFAYGSWISLDVRTPRPPAPPAEPPQWSWPELPRDRLLRSALVVGFLAAAGIGVWTSGWTPLSGQAGPYRPAPAAPAPPGVTAAPPATGRPTPPTATVPPTVPPTVLPAAPQAARPARDRPPATSAPKKKHRPPPATGPRENGPGRARDRHDPQQPAADAERPRSPQTTRRRPSETAGTPRAETRSRRPGKPSPSGKSRGGPGGEDRGGPAPAPRPGHTGSPAAPADRAPDRGTGPTAGTGSLLTVEDRLGAAYACRHLGPDDWRYAYCVTAWNDYRKRIGLP